MIALASKTLHIPDPTTSNLGDLSLNAENNFTTALHLPYV